MVSAAKPGGYLPSRDCRAPIELIIKENEYEEQRKEKSHNT